MKLRSEYEGQPPPDDPIEFHVWAEANECQECFGTGIDQYAADDDDFLDCPDCDGTGYTPEAQPYV